MGTRRNFLSASVAAAALVGAGVPAGAEELGDRGPGRPVRPQPVPPELRAILREVDEHRIEAIIRKLASFGTRHTLSSQTDPVRGIGAARDWIHGELSKVPGLEVQLQSYVQP